MDEQQLEQWADQQPVPDRVCGDNNIPLRKRAELVSFALGRDFAGRHEKAHQMTNPTSSDWSREAIARAYEQGCLDTHKAIHAEPELAMMPVEMAEFGEAASDYAHSALAAASIRSPSNPDTAGEVERRAEADCAWRHASHFCSRVEVAESQLAVLTALVAEKDAALDRASKQFAFYAEQHRAKTPPDHSKAGTNEYFEGVCDAARQKTVKP